MNHSISTRFATQTTLTAALLLLALPARAQDSIAGIIETNGYVVDWLSYLADTSEGMAGEVMGIIETNGHVAPEELQSILETHGYVLDDLAHVVAILDEASAQWLDSGDADAICARALAGGGGIGLRPRDSGAISVIPMGTGAINVSGGDASEIAVMAMGTGAIGVTPGCEQGASLLLLTDVLAALAADGTPEQTPLAEAEALSQLAVALDAAADALARL
jgi:hypothetical protein